MDGCYAFWQLGCVIDWDAWGAMGSLLAALSAVGITVFHERKDRRDRASKEKSILAQLYIEAKKILFVTEWSLEYSRKVQGGNLPEGFDAALNLAIKDIAGLNTSVYDLFSGDLLQISQPTAGLLIAQYSVIKTQLHYVKQLLEGTAELSPQKRFNKLEEHVMLLQTPAFDIVHTLGAKLGYKFADRSPGPESYSSLGLYRMNQDDA